MKFLMQFLTQFLTQFPLKAMKARIKKVDGKHVLLIPTEMLQQLGLSDNSVVEVFDVKGNIVVQPGADHALAAAERFHDLVHSALAMR